MCLWTFSLKKKKKTIILHILLILLPFLIFNSINWCQIHLSSIFISWICWIFSWVPWFLCFSKHLCQINHFFSQECLACQCSQSVYVLSQTKVILMDTVLIEASSLLLPKQRFPELNYCKRKFSDWTLPFELYLQMLTRDIFWLYLVSTLCYIIRCEPPVYVHIHICVFCISCMWNWFCFIPQLI